MTDPFTGHAVAIRRKEDPPIPGEPFISIAVARRIAAKMVAEALAIKEPAASVCRCSEEARNNRLAARMGAKFISNGESG